MDIVEQYIVDAIVAIRRVSEIPDAESIFKLTSTNNASNFTMSDTEDVLDELKHKGKIEKKLDSFFLVGDKSNVDSRNDQDTAHSELLKDQGKYITVDISVETPRLKM